MSHDRQLGSLRGLETRFSKDPIPVFSAGGSHEQFWHGQEYPRIDVHAACPLPATTSPTLQGALKDGFGEAVVAYDMHESCEFTSIDRFQKRFL